MARDRVYSLPRSKVGDFAFDEDVVAVFPDMIARSVPGYASILSLIEQLAPRFIRPGSHVYDLGCSLGAASLLIQTHAPGDCTIHAVDSSPAMVARLRSQLAQPLPRPADRPEQSRAAIVVHEADLRDVRLADASFVVINFTLQFVDPRERESVLQRVFDSLLPGGALLLSEKIAFRNPREQSLMTELHHDFKRAHGYSELEIAQKRTALENRLVPETLEVHVDRLRRLGFEVVVPWFQCFNFASLLAVKAELAA